MKYVHGAMAALCHIEVTEDPPEMGVLGIQCFTMALGRDQSRLGKLDYRLERLFADLVQT